MRGGSSCQCYFDPELEGGVHVRYDTRDLDNENFPKREFTVECGRCGWEWDGNEKTSGASILESIRSDDQEDDDD